MAQAGAGCGSFDEAGYVGPDHCFIVFEFDYPQGWEPDAPSARARAAAQAWKQAPRRALSMEFEGEDRLMEFLNGSKESPLVKSFASMEENSVLVTARFGEDAMHFVNSDVGRELRLRGFNARVVRGGVVRAGDKAIRL